MRVLELPPGAVARLHIVPEPQAQGAPFTVIVAPSAGMATPDAFFGSLTKPGAVSVMLTHDAGTAWTDRAGERLLAATLKDGGIAMMAFVRLADAMAAQVRLRKLVGGAA